LGIIKLAFEYNKKDHLVRTHQTVNVIAGSLQGDWLELGVTHLSANSRMGYFLWLNVRIETTNAAKVTANINASNTDTGTTLRVLENIQL
jgi:hypothetical protein